MMDRHHISMQTYYNTMQQSLNILASPDFRHSRNNVHRFVDDHMYQINRNTRTYNNTMADVVNSLITGEAGLETGMETVITYNIVPNSDGGRESETRTDIVSTATEIGAFQDASGETVCPITMEALVAGDEIRTIRHCGHVFRARALENWLSRSTVCPVCRYNLAARPAQAQAEGDEGWVHLLDALMRMPRVRPVTSPRVRPPSMTIREV